MTIHEDTAKARAHSYLHESGHEVSRPEFLREVHEGWRAYMLYIGGGYVPLTMAVLTTSHRDHTGPMDGASDAIETWEEWARKNKPEELGDDPFDPDYELHLEEIPQSAAWIWKEVDDAAEMARADRYFTWAGEQISRREFLEVMLQPTIRTMPGQIIFAAGPPPMINLAILGDRDDAERVFRSLLRGEGHDPMQYEVYISEIPPEAAGEMRILRKRW